MSALDVDALVERLRSPWLNADQQWDAMQTAAAALLALRAERDEDRRREYGYSQETVDALSKERDALRAERDALRSKLREWADECRECHGAGTVPHLFHDGDEDCLACSHIRALLPALAPAEQPADNPFVDDPACNATSTELHAAFEWLREVSLSAQDGKEHAARIMYRLAKLEGSQPAGKGE